VSALPEPLLAYYREADELQLPHLEVHGYESVLENMSDDQRFGPEWLCFGFDYYFSYMLCSREPAAEPAIAVWAHDSGTPIEATYGSVAEMIGELYEEWIADPERRADVVVKELPGDLAAAQVARLLPVATIAEAIALARKDAFRIEGVELPRALRCVRALQEAGGDCCLAGGGNASARRVAPERPSR
jgi:hypothetical protein